MVKQRCSFMNRTTKLNFLKSYLPKVLDERFCYLSPRIASDVADWSDLLGVSQDLSVFTLLKPCLASSVLYLAYFLHISFFSLDCFDITTDSMVFTLEIERCTNQTSLYVWSSSNSSFVTYIASFEEILVNDKLFGEIPWLYLNIEFMHIYGSLPRPPDVRSIEVGMYFLAFMSRLATCTLDVVDCGALWRNLINRGDLSEGELRFEGLAHIFEFEIDEEWLILLDLVCSSQECSYEVGTLYSIGRALCRVDEIMHLEFMVSEAICDVN